MIDSWSKFPDFPTRYARQVAISVALSRIAVGWHGIAAADTDADANPLGEDVNMGGCRSCASNAPTMSWAARR
jgi:hypothetical protein